MPSKAKKATAGTAAKKRKAAKKAQRPRSKGLHPRHARFVAEYLKDQNSTQAAKRAGYSPHTARVQGSRLLTYAAISEAIQKGLLRVAEKAEITVESLVTELQEARELALKLGQPSAAVAATMGKGKITGLLIERMKHSGSIGTYDLSKITDDELDKLEAILDPLAHPGGDTGGEDEARH